MKPIEFLPEAEQELLEAAYYYQLQSSGLSIDNLSEVERAVQSITETPNTWPIIEGKLRRRLVRRFPFGILFRIEPEDVVIIAIAHLRRKPGYWKNRINAYKLHI